MDAALAQAARDLIADAYIESVRLDAAEAVGWVIVCLDLETGRIAVTGPFDTPEEALMVAQRQHADVHRGHPVGEPGWSYMVHPMHAPDPRLADAFARAR